MSDQGPKLPTEDQWRQLGIRLNGELHAGKQSRVFDADLDGIRVAVKLTESLAPESPVPTRRPAPTDRSPAVEVHSADLPSLSDRNAPTDREVLSERMLAVEVLAESVAEVVPPMRIDDVLVHPVGEWLMTATRFVDGAHLNSEAPEDGRLMGGTLARLHTELDRLPVFPIPSVAALRVVEHDTLHHQHHDNHWQLLHGDFNANNLIRSSTGLQIIDFDDCGYGPVTYDIANALYMVLFDAEVHQRQHVYDQWRPAFLDGYTTRAGRAIDHRAIDAMIDLRVAALDRWLQDLPNAPIGIRTSPPAWHKTLRGFVASYRSSDRPNAD